MSRLKQFKRGLASALSAMLLVNGMPVNTFAGTTNPTTVDITVTKEWVDNNNEDNTRPASVDVGLYQEGATEPTQTVTLSKNAEGKWEGTFPATPVYDTSTGKLIKYEVKEVTVPEGYDYSVESGTPVDPYVYPTNVSTVDPYEDPTSATTYTVGDWNAVAGLTTGLVGATEVVFSNMTLANATITEYDSNGVEVTGANRQFLFNEGGDPGPGVWYHPTTAQLANKTVASDHYFTLTFKNGATILDGTSNGTTADVVVTCTNISVYKGKNGSNSADGTRQKIIYPGNKGFWVGDAAGANGFGGLMMDINFAVPGVSGSQKTLITFNDIDVVGHSGSADSTSDINSRCESVSLKPGDFESDFYVVHDAKANVAGNPAAIEFTYFMQNNLPGDDPFDGSMRAYARAQDEPTTYNSGMVARGILDGDGFTLRWTGTGCGTLFFGQILPFAMKATVDGQYNTHEGGTITPQTDWIYRDYGEMVRVECTPDTGYHIRSLKIDGTEVDLTAFSTDGVQTITNTGWTGFINSGKENVTLYQRANGKIDVYLPKQVFADPTSRKAPERKDHWIDVSYEPNSVASSYTITNYRVGELKGKKVWVDGDRTHVSSDLVLVLTRTANGTTETYNYTTDQLTWNGDEFTFTDIPLYDEDGNAYVYKVAEKPVPAGFEVSYSDDTFTITNTRVQDTKELLGYKYWVDGGKYDHSNYDYSKIIEVTLKRIPVDSDSNPVAGATEETILQKDFASKDITITWTNEADNIYKIVAPKYDDARYEYKYTVLEDVNVEEHGLEEGDFYVSTSEDGNSFTNTLDGRKTLTGTKIWQVGEGTVPTLAATKTLVKLDMKQSDGTTEKAYAYTADQLNWEATSTANVYKYTFKDLPKYVPDATDATKLDYSKQYTYTVTEQEIPNYTTTVDNTGLNFTNTRNEKIDIQGTKVWKDVDPNKTHDNATEVILTLYRQSKKTGASKEAVDPAPTPTWDGNTFKYSGLEKYDSEGYSYVYTVSEQEIAGYDTTYSDDTLTITNTQRIAEVSATKEWKTVKDGQTSTDAPEGATVVFTLYRDDEETSYTVTLDGTADDAPTGTGTAGYESAGWKASFVNLPQMDSTGHKYVYTIGETRGYEKYVMDPTTPVADKGIITNKHTENNKSVYTSTTDIRIDGDPVGVGQQLVYKIDYVNNTNKTADIKITDTIPQYTTYVGKASDNGQYDSANKEITWTIEDVDPGAGGTVSFTVEVTEAGAGQAISNSATVVDGENTYTTEPVVNNIPEKKVSTSSGGTDGSSVKVGDTLTYTITYKLEEDAESGTVTDKVPTGTAFLTADNDGTESEGVVTWNLSGDLLKAGEHRVSFEVEVTTDAIQKGTIENEGVVKIGDNDPATTNKVKNPVLVDVRAVKVWDDNDNADKVRPASVTVILKRNGKDLQPQQSAVLDKNNDWAYTWEDLPAEDADGNVYTYTVTESPVTDYTTTIVSSVIDDKDDPNNGATLFTVTNSHQQNKKSVFWGGATYTLDGSLVSPGQVVKYTINYGNNSTETKNYTITDTIPVWTEFVAVYDGGTHSGNQVKWEIENVEPGQGGTVSFEVRIKADAQGQTIRNKSEIYDGSTTIHTNEVTNPVPKKEVKDEGKNPINGKDVVVGQELTYEISYTLTEHADTVTITDKVPTGTEYVAGSASDGGTESGGVVTWSLGSQSSGTTYTVSFKVKVLKSALQQLQIDNQATLKVDDDPEVKTNTVTNYPKTSVIVKKVWDDDDYAKRPESVTVTLSASPEMTIEGATQTLSEDNGWTYTWEGLTPKTETGTVTYTVTETEVEKYTTKYSKDQDRSTGIYTWTVTNSHKEDKKKVTLNGATYEVDGKPVGVGDKLTYTIDYTNNTSTDKATVTVTDTYPENTKFVSADFDDVGGVTYDLDEDTRTIKWTITNVDAGVSGQVSFTVEVLDLAGGLVLENDALVVDGKNQHTTNTVTNPVPKKKVLNEDASKSIENEGVHVGDVLTYKITFKLVEDAADDVLVTDSIPSGTEYVTGSADNGGTESGGVVSWNLGKLTARDEAYGVSFKVKVTSAALSYSELENIGTLKIGENGPEVKTNPVKNPVKTAVKAHKVWDDKDDADGVRTEKVNVTLMANGHTASNAEKADIVATVELDATNAWSTEWTDLAAVVGGSTVDYTVVEDTVSNYTTTYATSSDAETAVVDWEVTNKHVPQNKEVSYSVSGTNIDGKSVQNGDVLWYRIDYVNNTNDTADIEITDTIPQYTEYNNDADPSATFSGGKLTWNIADVPAGEGGQVRFSVTVANEAAGAILVNKAIVFDGTNTNNTNVVRNPVPKKEVQDESGNDINHANVEVGDKLTYVISYSLGKDAETVTITDKVPTGTKYVPGSATNGGTESGGVVTWNMGKQAKTEEGAAPYSVSFQVEVTEDALKLAKQDESIENTATIDIDDDPVVTNTVYNPVPEKDVHIADSGNESDDTNPVEVGDILTYDIDYVLTEDAKYVKVSDKIPTGTALVTGSIVPADGKQVGDSVVWEYETGLKKDAYHYSFKVEVTKDALKINELTNTYKIKVGKDGPEKESNPVKNPVNTEVEVSKEWKKGEADYQQTNQVESIQVTLMANGATATDAVKEGDDPVHTMTVGENWTTIWEGLKTVFIGEDGTTTPIEYTVVENDPASWYDVTVKATDSNTGKAITVTNDYKAKGEITLEAEKKLEGRDGEEWQWKSEEEKYTFGLYKGGELIETKTATKDNPHVYFTALSYDQTDIDAEGLGSYQYQIKELYDPSGAPASYMTYDAGTVFADVYLADAGDGKISTTVSYTKENPTSTDAEVEEIEEGGFPTFTNVFEKTKYTVVKTWDDADDRLELRPDELKVTVFGMLSGDEMYSREVTLNADNGWMVTLDDLPMYWQGQELIYFADENVVPGGYTKATESNASPSDAEEGEEVDRSTLIVNTTDTGDLSIKKFVNKATEEFDKTDTADYQFTVTVENGHFEDITKDVIFYVAKQNSKDGEKAGTVTFQGGKAKFTLHSDEILRIVGLPAGAAYTVEESVDAATHYDPVIYNNEGVIIKGKTQYVSYINRELDKTLITIEKKWEDGDDRDGFRPNQILVDVFKIQGGEEKLIEEDLKLTAENSWVAKLNPNGYNAVATISEASKSSANASASEAYREQASASVATASANSASFSDAEVADAFDEDGNLLDGTIFDDLFSAVKEAVTDVTGKIGALFGIDDGTKISYRVEEKEIPKYYDVTYDDCEATQNDDGSWSFTLNFTNTHELMPPVWIDPPVKKIVTVIRGTISTPETFNFRMIGLDGTTAFPKGATVYKDADGNYYVQLSITGEGSKEFGKIEYTKVGTYKYRVYEIAGNAQYYTYTTDYYDITVVVKEEGGALVETVTVKKNGTETVYSVTTRDGVKGEKLGIQFVNKYDRTTGGGGNPPGGGGNPPGRRTPPPADPGTPVIPEAPPVPGALPKTGESSGKAIPMLFAMLAMFGALFGFRKRDDDEE